MYPDNEPQGDTVSAERRNGAVKRSPEVPEQAESVRRGVPGWLRQHGIALAVSLVLAGALAWLLRQGALPVVPPRSAFARTRWEGVAAYCVVWVLLQLLRAGRWKLLLGPVGLVTLGRVTRVGLVGYGALVVLPFRMGEAVRPALMRACGGLSLVAVTGTIGAERVIDGLFISLTLMGALALSTPLSPLPERIGALPVPAAVVPGAALMASSMFVVLFLGMGAFYFFRDRARSITLRVLGLVSNSVAVRTAEAIERLASGLGFLAQWRASVPFVALTAIYWMGYGLSIWLLLWGTGVEGVTFAESLVICGVLAVGVIVPSAPGFFGSFQISLYAGMVMFLPIDRVVGPGAAFVFLLYVAQILITLVLAVLAGVWERRVIASVSESF